MNNEKKNELNLQIRKMLKEFGVKSHKLVAKRFETDLSNCKVSLKLKIDSKPLEEFNTIIKIN